MLKLILAAMLCVAGSNAFADEEPVYCDSPKLGKKVRIAVDYISIMEEWNALVMKAADESVNFNLRPNKATVDKNGFPNETEILNAQREIAEQKVDRFADEFAETFDEDTFVAIMNGKYPDYLSSIGCGTVIAQLETKNVTKVQLSRTEVEQQKLIRLCKENLPKDIWPNSDAQYLKKIEGEDFLLRYYRLDCYAVTYQ